MSSFLLSFLLRSGCLHSCSCPILKWSFDLWYRRQLGLKSARYFKRHYIHHLRRLPLSKASHQIPIPLCPTFYLRNLGHLNFNLYYHWMLPSYHHCSSSGPLYSIYSTIEPLLAYRQFAVLFPSFWFLHHVSPDLYHPASLPDS